MTSPSRSSNSSPLDRGKVSSLIADLNNHEQKLLKNLPSKWQSNCILSSKDLPLLEQTLNKLELLWQSLQTLIEKAEQVGAQMRNFY